MTALEFTVADIAPEPYAAAPTLLATLGIREGTGATVHALALRCQLRIEPRRRRYGPEEEAALTDLFGTRDRWGTTLAPFPWLHASTVVPGFDGGCEATLPLTCTYDFDVAAARYLHALGDGTVPLLALFSGTVFTRGTAGFAVEQVPWDREARYDLPVRVWRDLMRAHFPDTGYARLTHATLAALGRFKAERGLIDLDAAITELLAAAGAGTGVEAS
ncbi:DUF6084 family protein [Rhodococcus zopfii]|uniref:Uncharacterized protein n=1 Tax=Rhodococcus zopfii TaxID=43772 RepID=A0ABU3WYI4_9NOCA|nr:DUF6084 family protein [Rhodococcus zopfii]MDV2478418.1 hypothetical protein [Rhodococcus zopfii]